jgi:prolyl-tRNA synthetase
LEEPLIVRPTSETIIGATFARWVQSYRDLPILLNQWCNVVRWELRTRLFLRTTEFLWQEGHTVHATEAEAREETMRILDLYADFAEHTMAMPVIKGEKTAGERFPGAVDTFTIEAMMQDRKALQAGTSHFLGQNFSKAQEIRFQNESGELEYAWTTSWGVTTRLVGALVMTHGDDDGLILPPKLAPAHVVIMPIYRSDDERAEVLAYCGRLEQELAAQSYAGEPIRVRLDNRDIRGGEKKWQWVKRGVPLRVEIGPRDVANQGVTVARRDSAEKPMSWPRERLVQEIAEALGGMQQNLLDRAGELRDAATVHIDDLKEFEAFFTPKNADQPEIHGGLAYSHFVESPEMDEKLKELKVTIRCIPLDGEEEPGKCIFTGRPSKRRGVFAKAY